MNFNFNIVWDGEKHVAHMRSDCVPKYYKCEDWATSNNIRTIVSWNDRYPSTISSVCWELPKTNEGWVVYPQEKTKQERIKEAIKSRCFPGILIKPSYHPLPDTDDIREQRARETLRRVIGEEKWNTFVRKGFIQIRGKSGKYYQIFPSHKFTHVFENGRMVERLCVVMNGKFPPTDLMIMRFLMILNDEQDFWKRAVKWGVPTYGTKTQQRAYDVPSLLSLTG